TLQVQQDLFRQWSAMCPGFSKVQPWADQFQKFQKDWSKTMVELTRKYQEVWDRQYKAGLESLEEACRLGSFTDPAELREKMVELWQKSFDCLKELTEAQIRNFQSTMEKWMELAKKTNP